MKKISLFCFDRQNFSTFVPLMATIRQEKIASLLQQELSFIFQKETKVLCLGSMVSVTNVKVSPDLSVARVYLSIFAAEDKIISGGNFHGQPLALALDFILLKNDNTP